MKKQFKPILLVFSFLGVIIWHHQATLFQRHIHQNLEKMKELAGPCFQVGEVVVSKYLFKAEFKKPVLELNRQNLEAFVRKLFPHSNVFKTSQDSKESSFHFNYRLADRLVLSYNPFWRELTLFSHGDGELGFQMGDCKANMLIPDREEINQGKVKIAFALPSWLQAVKNMISSSQQQTLFKISSSARKTHILDAQSQQPFYTDDYTSTALKVAKKTLKNQNYYIVSTDLKAENVRFYPALASVFSWLKPSVLTGLSHYVKHEKFKLNEDELQNFLEVLKQQIITQQFDPLSLIAAIPSVEFSEEIQDQHTAMDLKVKQFVDYNRQDHSLKMDADYEFQAKENWPDYFESVIQSYHDFVNKFFASKHPVTTVPWQNWKGMIDHLPEAGPLKGGYKLTLHNLQKGPLQSQGELKFANKDCSFLAKGEYKSDQSLSIDLELENHEKIMDALQHYFSKAVDNQTFKVILPALKEELVKYIQKLSTPKDEKNPHLRVIPLRFDFQKQLFTVSGLSLDDPIVLALLKMILY